MLPWPLSPLGLPVQSGTLGWKTALGCVQSNTEAEGTSSAPNPQVTSYVGKTSSPLHMQRCRVVAVTLPETKVLFLCPHPKVMSVHGIRMFRKHSERERSKASLKQLAGEGF